MMSSTSSRDNRHNLPPIRSVLGEQLDLPVTHPGYRSPYDLGEIYQALPPICSNFPDIQPLPRPLSIDVPRADSHHNQSRSKPPRPSTYPPSTYPPSQQSSCQLFAITQTYDPSDHPSCNPLQANSTTSKPKKYACTWEGCHKRFERQHALDTHMNIHLEQKPFACPIPCCGKFFNVRSNMRRHLLTHKDAQLDRHFAQGNDVEDDERSAGDFHRHRHDPTFEMHRPTERHYNAAPGRSYHSSTHRI